MFARHLAAMSGVVLAAAMLAQPASALTMAECSSKFSEAKKTGTLNGMSWGNFRLSQCSAEGRDKAITPQASAATPLVTPATPAPGAAQKLSFKECGAKYQAAKAANGLNGKNWAAFRIAECGHSNAAKAAKDGTPTGSGVLAERKAQPSPALKASMPAPASVTFPTALAAEFSSETLSKQRMHTCLQGYRQNKQAGTLSGLRWVQKGGGYYSLCNTRLKASS